MANDLRLLQFADGNVAHLPADAIRRISAAERALTYYLSAPISIPHDLLAALTLTEQQMAQFRALADVTFFDNRARLAQVQRFKDAAALIEQMREELRQGVL